VRGPKTSLVVVLTEEERTQLLRWSRSTSLPAGLVTRAQAIYLIAGGLPLTHTAQAVGLTQQHVRQWVKRFLEKRLQGLNDLPGRGRKPSFSPSGGGLHRQDGL
jgi:hypothetical protein